MAYQDDVLAAEGTVCYHCGDPVRGEGTRHDGKTFCCNGCRTVYDILRRNELCDYYQYAAAPGITPKPVGQTRFEFLDDAVVQRQLREFTDGSTSTVVLTVPDMHCSSCVWLLEHLYRLDPGVLHSRVDFLKKRITIRYSEETTTLRRVVELLAGLGYEPLLTAESAVQREHPALSRSLYYRIGVAGFCFGNIMILSFPEYLSGGTVEEGLRTMFTIASLALALPVVFYAATGYVTSAVGGLRKGIVNLDVPIAIGILILFGRSAWEILTGTGAGYLDSLSGLVLFLLVGRLFQNKTYDHLNFERTYASYFPLAVTVRRGGTETTMPIRSLAVGDRVILRNGEILPADGVLLSDEASVDYSFITGEAHTVTKASGDLVYAGGRQVGSAVELEVVKEVSQSYLAQLWNDSGPARAARGGYANISNTIGKYFTAGTLLLAAAAGVVWFPVDAAMGWNAVTAILIVACPCALALAVPFAFGTTMRIFGLNGFYLKHAGVVESLARVKGILFDKTGTLTRTRRARVTFAGGALTEHEQMLVASLARNSHHPHSRAIWDSTAPPRPESVREYTETVHQGIEGSVGGFVVRLGSRSFAGRDDAEERVAGEDNVSRVYVSIDGVSRGYFLITAEYREGMHELMERLRRTYGLGLLSGDTDAERSRMEEMFGRGSTLLFRRSPAGKLDAVRETQARTGRVLLVGDGLNDAGALQQADVGLSVTDDISAFTPACDAILEGDRLASLDRFLGFSRVAVRIVLFCFAISLVYNAIGLVFAFSGTLSPLIAAILMPVSSMTVVSVATLATRQLSRRWRLL